MVSLAFLKKALPIANLVIDFVQKAWGTVKNIFKDIPQVTSKSKTEDIAKVGENLGQLRHQMLTGIEPVIAQVQEEINAYLDEVHVWLEAKGGVLQENHVALRRSYRAIDNAKREAKSFWENSMCRRISLDDMECSAILHMPDGARRDEAMRVFVQSALAETAAAYGEELKADMARLADDLMEDIDEVRRDLDRRAADITRMYEAQQKAAPEEFTAAMTAAQEKKVRYEAMLVCLAEDGNGV